MTPFKLHLIFGFILLAAGILFGFLFAGWEISETFRTDPTPYLLSFKKQLYDLILLYTIMLGLLNIVLALLISYFAGFPKTDWIIFGLVFVGSVLLIVTGFWYASAGPSFKWEPRCAALTIALVVIVLGIGLEIYKIIEKDLSL